MICNMCQKSIIDDHFKKTRKYYYHLDKCWPKVKKFYFVILPSILGIGFLVGMGFLIGFLLAFLKQMK